MGEVNEAFLSLAQCMAIMPLEQQTAIEQAARAAWRDDHNLAEWWRDKADYAGLSS